MREVTSTCSGHTATGEPAVGQRGGLTAGELAFVRAWAEGLDVELAHRRYMDTGPHAPSVSARGQLRALLGRLRAQALHHGRTELAALFQRDPAQMRDKAGPPAPSLAAFAAGLPADFYAEAELLALYEAKHGRVDARSAARRRQRLRLRLVAAVQEMATLGPRRPQLCDPVGDWLDPALAHPLAAVGVHRLADLLTWVGRHGPAWPVRVPRIGPHRASLILDWWAAHGHSLPALAVQRAGPPASHTADAPPIKPVERFHPPPDLDGRCGLNRAPASRCRLAASTDRDAVLAWLARREPGSATWRAYRKEAERWLLWSVLARGKPLSSLDGSDCQAYLHFLAGPDQAWCAARHTRRDDRAWRPFESALSPRSMAMAVSVLRACCAWLVAQGYLLGNPWVGVPSGDASRGLSPVGGVQLLTASEGRKRTPAAPAPADAVRLRTLSAGQWQQLTTWLSELPQTPQARRWRCLTVLAGDLGLRMSELAGVRSGDLTLDADAGGLQVHGPAGRVRRVRVGSEAAAVLRDGLATAPAPLLARLDGRGPLSPARLRQLLHEMMAAFLQAMAVRQPPGWASGPAPWPSRLTTNGLRHSAGLRAAAAGLSPATLQRQLGHARRHTIAPYYKGRTP